MKKLSPYALLAISSVFVGSMALTLSPAVAHADLVADNLSPETPTYSSALPEGERRYIVKYGNYVDAEAESKSLEQDGIEVKGTLSHAMKASVVVATPEEMESLKESVDVASIEPDSRASISSSTSIWGLDRVDQRSGRDGQYSFDAEGAGVNVYVVDTGLLLSHSEFSGRVPAGWSAINDGKGVIDCNGHGTHVAGTAAGTTYGVAKKANIIPVRTLECDGSGWSSTVMAGIDWAISHHVAGQPAVMNLSVGGFTNASFDQAVQSAVNDGITVVAAAGNSGQDACLTSPARVPSAITVAATNINDAQASWSNYGSCVDIQAPGVSVRSAWNNSPTGDNTLDGTSMATPHVSGAAAILLSRNRSLSPADLHQTMINNATIAAVSANKGATPNRLLFVPPPTPPLPSCANLQLGAAWAGVGTYCGLQGAAASVPSTAEATVTASEAPVSASTFTPDANDDAPAPARVNARSLQAGSTSAQYPPDARTADEAALVVEPEVIPPAAARGDAAKDAETAPSEKSVSTPLAASAPSPLRASGTAPVGDTAEAASEGKADTGVTNPAWATAAALVLGGLVFAYALRRLNLSRRLSV
jgi:subtilisin family serine protease